MEFFETILLMLLAVWFSNIINRFLPEIAIPLIQVALGVLLAIPLANHVFELESELFLLIFLAPLLFHDGQSVDKKALWRERKPIFVLSIVLVFVTVAGIGYFIHWLIPVLPLAACFALAAALAPTDAVAVSALAEKVQIPERMMHTLEGESLINDASGLVSFQFAVAALLTGTFSLANASLSFILMSLGGILVGMILSWLKIYVVVWLRQLGIENLTSYTLLELLLPFIIFVTAEVLGVNGILAVVSGGMVHSFSYRRLTQEDAQLKTLSNNTWSVLTFSLNGLVFVLLGTQLPKIIYGVWHDNHINNGTLILYILGLTAVLLGIRFCCFRIFKNFNRDPEQTKKESLQQTLLYTISGVRGTITLVSALSLPLVLNDGPFTQRTILVAVAAGVILVTLLLANFTMPLFAEKRAPVTKETNPDFEIDLLRHVIKNLKTKETESNRKDLNQVIKLYNERVISLLNHEEVDNGETQLRILTLQWKWENTISLIKDRQIDIQVAFNYLRRINRRLYHLTRDSRYRRNMFYARLIRRQLGRIRLTPLNREVRREQRQLIQQSNSHYLIEQLKGLSDSQFPPELVDFYLTNYLKRVHNTDPDYETTFDEWLMYAFQLERDYLQTSFEEGDINRSELKTYRDGLLAIENTVQFTQ